MAHIVFDFDGTLADMKGLLMEVGNEIATRKGWQTIDDATFEELRRGNMRDGLKRLGIPLREVPFMLLEGKRALNLRADEIRLFPGIFELVSNLYAAGHEIFVLSTNSRKLIQYVVDHQQLADKLTVLPSSGLFGKAASLKRLIRMRRLNKKAVWMVGDELRDIEAGKRAGIQTIAVMWGLQHPDTLKAAGPTFAAETPEQIEKFVQ